MSEVVLTGLDGSQLLGFLAGLGALEVLNSTMPASSGSPGLAWRYAGGWRPVVTGAASIDELADRIMVDSRGDLVEEMLGFRYLKVEKRGARPVHALTPPVAVLRAWTHGRLQAGRWRGADYAASLMCETATDHIDDDKVCRPADLAAAHVPCDENSQTNEAVLQTPFDFTSRNAQFLEQIAHVREMVTLEVLRQELGDGIGVNSDRIMRWDTLADLPGALFGSVRSTPRPCAEWLAFRGLAFFVLCGRRGQVTMAGLTGRRKAGRFSWALWGSALSRDLVRTALGCGGMLNDPAEREARGGLAAFGVELAKDATGYDGSVSPSRPLEEPPRSGF